MDRAWQYLKENDIVDIVAPGYPTTLEELQGGIDFLNDWKLRPRVSSKILAPHFLHSNEDDVRFETLKTAILAEDSKVIWCLRGGYGANRLLPYLAKMKKPRHKKLLIGISDISSLHTFLTQEWGWVTLHGPLLDRLGKGLIAPKYEKELHNILWGKTKEVEFKTLKPMNKAAKDLKQVKASVIGGNMTVLQSTLGTPWQIKTKGKFIFFEELAERGYRIDRIFEHFRQCGLFKGCSGIILGDFIGGQEPQGGSKIDPVLERWAQDLAIPVFKGLQAGHGEIQRPIPFNTECELVKHNSTYRLSILTGGK